MIISVVWNTMFTDYWKAFISELSGDENTVFFGLRSWWKDDIYWLRKSSSFDIFGDGKHGPFLDKKMMERFYLLLLESSCFELFGGANYGLFWAKKLVEKLYLQFTEKFLFWTLRRWEIRPFFEPKSWCKDDINLFFFSFQWYSRTWEIWLFVHCT